MDATIVPAGTIVVGVDGSSSAERAMQWAADEAASRRRDVTLVHAISPGDLAWLTQAGLDHGAVVESLLEDARRLLKLAREEVIARAPGVEVHELSLVTDPRTALVELSRRADLVVLGSRGRGPVRSLLLGSVGMGVMRQAGCPVVIHRPGPTGTVRRGVLVGADASDHSATALELAFDIASRHRLELTVLHCYWSDPFTGGDEEGRLALAEAVAGLQERYPDVTVTRRVAPGDAATQLVEAGRHMDLLVIGAHAGGIGAEVLFGSVAASVVEHATCPVAVVPPRPA